MGKVACSITKQKWAHSGQRFKILLPTPEVQKVVKVHSGKTKICNRDFLCNFSNHTGAGVLNQLTTLIALQCWGQGRTMTCVWVLNMFLIGHRTKLSGNPGEGTPTITILQCQSCYLGIPTNQDLSGDVEAVRLHLQSSLISYIK